MKRRFLAFLLAFLMLFSSVPAQVWADMFPENETSNTAGQTASVTTEQDDTAEDTKQEDTAEDTKQENTAEDTKQEDTTEDTKQEDTADDTKQEDTADDTKQEDTADDTKQEDTKQEDTAEDTKQETPADDVEEEKSVTDHVHGEGCFDAEGNCVCTLEEHVHTEDCCNAEGERICGVTLPTDVSIGFALPRAVTEPELTGNWAADTLAIAQCYEGYAQETDEDGNLYTVFGAHFNDAANTAWNTYFIAYCLARAGVETAIFPIQTQSAEGWKNSLEKAGYFYAKDSGYTPVAGDLIFWSPWHPTTYNVGIFTSSNEYLTADMGGQEGKVGSQKTWDGQVLGYARIPNSDGTLKQTLTAKVYTDGTFATEDTSASAVAEGNLPVNAEIRVFPVTLTEEQQQALRANGQVVAAYGVKVFVDSAEYTGTINDPVNVKITADVFGSGAAMMPYDLADLQKLSASLSGSTLSLNVKLPTSFALVGISSAEVTTAAELKAAVEMGVPEIKLGADIKVDAANDNMTVSKAVKIELNGKTLTAAGDEALFNITSSGSLTMEDNGTESVTTSSGTDISRPDSVDDAALGSVAKADNGKAVLTYYTTKSTVTNPNGATRETRYQHTVTAAGMIENKTTQPLFVVNGGTLNIEGGMYVGDLDGGNTGRGILQNSGTTNLKGGYLCGFNVGYSNLYWDGEQNDFGGAVRATGGSLNIGEAVIAANQALSGAGIYARGTRVTLTNGVISGNKAIGESDAAISDNGGPHFGGAGVYLGENSTITIDGADSYITNNSAPDAKGYADGGAAIFARKWTNITINNGYITSNTAGGGGGAIRTIYGTEHNYADTASDVVRQSVEMTIDIKGGFICGNLCKHAEGGGVSINAGTGCWVTGGYINNNVTLTQRDWGGGGLFNANGSYLEIHSVLITENTAKGLGGGIGGCSTGDIHLAVTDGGALFDNIGEGKNWSGEGSQKREDVMFVEESPNFDMENADDYFCVHNSKVEAQMLGRGSCDWVGTRDDERVTPPQYEVLEATTLMGLTSYAMDPGKKEARMAARAYINGNYSNVHGGGIMCNGVLDVGTPMEGPTPVWLEVVGEKTLTGATLVEGMFTFEMELLDGETGALIATGTNRTGDDNGTGTIAFGKQLWFQSAGEYTYIIREKQNYLNGSDDTTGKITYSDVHYKMTVKTAGDSTVTIDTVTIEKLDTADKVLETETVQVEKGGYVSLDSSLIRFENRAKTSLIIQAHKVWDDDNDRDGIRPESIQVALYANNEYVTTSTLTTSTTGTEKSWSAQFRNLDKYDENGKEIQYSVREVTVPDGYEVSYSVNEHDHTFVITNTHKPETTSITANKQWDDGDNQDGIRPESITLTLFANGSEVTEYTYEDAEGNTLTQSGKVTVTPDEDGNWSYTWTGLKKKAGGKVITYSVKESAITGYNDGQPLTGTADASGNVTLKNVHVPEETQISFQKKWDDNNDQDGKRPESIRVNLLENGEEIKGKTVYAKDNYSGTFTNLPKYENGVEIKYSISEDEVEGYTTVITGSPEAGFTITNTHTPEKTDLSVKKVWNDFSNQDGKRVPGVVVALYGNDKTTALATATLNAENSWKHTWKDLDLYAGGNYIDYSVVEIQYVDAAGVPVTGTPPGYSVSHTYNNPEGSTIWTEATVTNSYTPELTTLNIQKQWDDGNNQDGIRPEKIELTLWKTTKKPTQTITMSDGHIHYIVDPSDETAGWTQAVDKNGDPYTMTMQANANGGWDADFKDLPKYQNGVQIYYAVKETPVEGYETSYELAPGTNVLYIKNTHVTEKTEISVSKNWDDANDQDGKRPASITVSLYGRDKQTPLETVTLSAANGWSYQWTGLDKYYKGTAIIYTVTENAVDGYNVNAQGVAQDVTASPDASGKITLTNTHIPETTSISVYKEWDDAKNQDDMRPESITVKLLADGQDTGKSLTLNAGNNWQGAFAGLPVYQEKTDITAETAKIQYTFQEEKVEGYDSVVKVENGIVKITNTHKPEVVSVTAKKIWNDGDNQDVLRPESITLHLLADTEHTKLVATVTPDANGNWSYTWNDLPKFANGKEIIYGVQEVRVADGYTSAVTGSAAAGFVVTNTYTPEETYITVQKHWVDGNNQDGVRPGSITVELLENSKSTSKTLTLNAENNWYGSFTGLAKYENGVKIQYSVQETAVEGYESEVTGDMENGFVIENTRDVEKTRISVSKVWEDHNDRDGVRPKSVTVTLYRNGVSYNTVTLTPDEYGDWSHTWTDLDVHYAQGTGKYTYAVAETVPEGYTATVTGSEAQGFVITNKRDFDVTSIPVRKVWDDAQNQDGKRPESVTVELIADGTPTGKTLTLNASNNWQGAFTDLPVNVAKEHSSCLTTAIKYTVQEKTVTGYTLSITGDAETGYILTNTHKPEEAELNVRKVWSDFNNKDGARPYAVVITLHKNSAATEHTLVLSSENSWSGVWENMPRYEGGNWIAYTVVETGFYQTAEDLASGNLTVGVPSGYMVSHKYDTTNTASPTATVTNTYAPETTGLDVQKYWDDDNNRDGLRPSEITVALYRKVGETGTWEEVKDDNGDPVTRVLNQTNQWDADFLGLPKKDINGTLIYYNVVEEDVPAGYEASYQLDPATGVVTITNTHKVSKIDIGVRKEWDDKENQDKIRPEQIVVSLYANGMDANSTKTLNAENGWTAEWKDLYACYKGKDIVYSIVEEEVPEGYTVSVTGDETSGFVVTNTHKPETVDIPVIKHWDDNDNQDNIRPAYITVTLFANEERTDKVLTLNAKNLWRGTFTGLDKYKDGEEIHYSIQEAKIAGYNVQDGVSQILTAEVVDGKITLTNVHVPDKTQMTVVKKWHDDNDRDGKRPATITVHLLAGGEHVGTPVVLSEENGWTYTWTDLQKNAAGNPIIYTVYEEPIVISGTETASDGLVPVPTVKAEYTVDYVRDSDTQITIHNRYISQTTQIKVIKSWKDHNDRDGLRPEAVQVELLKNGKATGDIKTLNVEGSWTAIWEDLPEYEDGKLIEYTVKEISVPGYTSQVTKSTDEADTYLLENTHAPETTNIQVTKTWRDDDNNDGVRPDGLIVQLFADGSKVDGGRVVLSESNDWQHTYQSTAERPLYVNQGGETIRYYVQEIGYVKDGVEYSGMPDGYVGSTSQGDGYTIEITNTRASAKVSLCVDKVWKDGDNADSVRPSGIQITLLKNGKEVETVTLDQKNGWSYTWKDLNKYVGGEEVAYTVRESEVKDYTADYSYTTSADGKKIQATITNTHTPDNQWVTIQKVWKDNHDAEDLRPGAITVQLYKNGKAYGDPIILSAANNWKLSMLLPVAEDGERIEWTVKETKIPRHYTVSYDQKTLTITNTIQSKEVPQTGDDNNLMLWVGLLGLCGAGAATVLFADRKKKRGK